MILDPEQHDRYISIWSKVIDTQMHFNEMAVKSRQLGLTFVAAALGVAVVLLRVCFKSPCSERCVVT